MPKDCNDFYKYWEPVYDFKDIAEVPATEAEYIMGIVDIEDIRKILAPTSKILEIELSL